jgi:hypothetical protein
LNVLICFDTDGTLETSNGPVKTDRLRELERQGAKVVIVSPSSARPQGFVCINDLPSRLECLQKASQTFPSEMKLYVSDNGDMDIAKQAGFIYIDRMLFV